MNGAERTYSGSGYSRRGDPAPTRSFEERAQAKEQMMASVRESSQQERRVYVGNLSYDVKWHHLKDFMRQGKASPSDRTSRNNTTLTGSLSYSGRSSLRRCFTTSKWNVEGGRLHVDGWSFWFFLVVGTLD